MKTKLTTEQQAITALKKLAASTNKCKRLAGSMRRMAKSLPPGPSAILAWHPDEGFSVMADRRPWPTCEIARLGSVDDYIDEDSIANAASDLADRLENTPSHDKVIAVAREFAAAVLQEGTGEGSGSYVSIRRDSATGELSVGDERDQHSHVPGLEYILTERQHAPESEDSRDALVENIVGRIGEFLQK